MPTVSSSKDATNTGGSVASARDVERAMSGSRGGAGSASGNAPGGRFANGMSVTGGSAGSMNPAAAQKGFHDAGIKAFEGKPDTKRDIVRGVVGAIAAALGLGPLGGVVANAAIPNRTPQERLLEAQADIYGRAGNSSGPGVGGTPGGGTGGGQLAGWPYFMEAAQATAPDSGAAVPAAAAGGLMGRGPGGDIIQRDPTAATTPTPAPPVAAPSYTAPAINYETYGQTGQGGEAQFFPAQNDAMTRLVASILEDVKKKKKGSRGAATAPTGSGIHARML